MNKAWKDSLDAWLSVPEFKQTLIDLGWTPPEDTEKLKDRIDELQATLLQSLEGKKEKPIKRSFII